MSRPPRIGADEELLGELAAAYGSGLSIRALASIRGWSYGATHARLHVAAQRGLTQVRPRGQHSSGRAASAAGGR